MVTSRAGAGVERASQVGGRADAHVGRPMIEKGVPTVGVDYGYLWSRAPEATDAPQDEVAGEDPARWSSNLVASVLWKVQRGSVALWSSLPCMQKVTLAKELQAGGYPRVVVRSDGEPALLAHVRAARAMTMVADVPFESVHEQVSKEQSPGNGLAEGAVKELKAKIRTLRHSAEMSLGRRIQESHGQSKAAGAARVS